jgi:HEAT repeat protein
MRPLSAVALIAVLAVASPAFADDSASTGGVTDTAASDAARVDVSDVVARLKSKEGDQRLVAAGQALEITDDAVTLPLIRLLGDEDFGVRAAAIRALAKRSTTRGKKDAARALAARMPKLAKSEHGEGELIIVVEALGELAQPSSVKPLFANVDDDTGDDVFEARMNAVARIPDASAIEELIQYLARRGRGKWAGRKRAVTNALQSATGQRLGGDPDAWRAWWKENGKTFDFGAAAERRTEESDERARRDAKKRDRKRGRKKAEGQD